jgi:hypothetical protein
MEGFFCWKKSYVECRASFHPIFCKRLKQKPGLNVKITVNLSANGKQLLDLVKMFVTSVHFLSERPTKSGLNRYCQL